MNKKNYALLSILATALLATGCGSNNDGLKGKYTYNTYLETNPKTWNVHTWQTNDESYITSFTEIGFYDCILNSTKDGYEFVTEMASEFPVDVSMNISDAEFEKYYKNIGNMAPGYVWDIALNPNAKWEDGTAIKADDYVESLKRQLDSEMGNFRADSYYASNFVIANAEKYYKQHQLTIEPLYDCIDDDGSWKKEYASNVVTDGNYYINLGRYTPYIASVFSNADTSMNFYQVLNNRSTKESNAVELAAQRITDAVGNYLIKYVDHSNEPGKWNDVESSSQIKDDMWNYNIEINEFSYNDVQVRKTLDNAADTEKYSKDALVKDLKTFVAAIGRNGKFSTANGWRCPLFGSIYNDFEQAWDSDTTGVGIKKLDDYKIRLYLGKQISNLDLKFTLSSNWLVRVDLYDQLTKTTGGKKATNYATNSIANYMSYGPYKLTQYESGHSMTMEKNDQWYGYTDGKHQNQFQMTGIKTRIISEHNTAVQSFVKGDLDDITLTKTDMAKFGNSSRRTTTYESYTQKISINSSRSKLAGRQSRGINKTILANDNFRKGLSLILNRNDFASQTTAGSKGFTGLLNDLYLTDVAIGEMYRNTKQGKSVYPSVYGKLGGDPYAADYKESALSESANGFNYQMGVKLIEKAIVEELQRTDESHLQNGDNLKFEFRVYDNTSETTVSMMTFLRNNISKAIDDAVNKIKQTNDSYKNLALTFELEAIKDENYYDTAKNGGYDFIFSTWGGAAINPYGLMQVYCDSTFDSCCEFGFKGQQSNVTLGIDINGDGKITTKSFNDWYQDLNNNYTEQDRENEDFDQEAYDLKHKQKLNILAALEAGIINRFEAIPLVARGTSSLTSYKVENGSDAYISLVGYGGVRFMTFNYDDAEWADLVSKGEINEDLYKE